MSKRSVSQVNVSEISVKKKSKKTTSSISSLLEVNNSSLPFTPNNFDCTRARGLTISDHNKSHGDCVILWMSRDQRVECNHAMLYASSVAIEHNIPLKVVFNMVPKFLEATIRQYDFMIG